MSLFILLLSMVKQKAKRRFNRGGQARERESSRIKEGKDECHRYSIQDKIRIVEFAMVRIEEDLASLNVIADEVGVHSTTLLRWFNKLPIYRYIAKNDQVRFSLSTGRRGQLEDIGTELLAFVEDLHENGYAVSRKMIVMQACRLLGSDCPFSSKSYAAKAQSVSRWMAKNELSVRSGTESSSLQSRLHPKHGPDDTGLLLNASYKVS